MNRSHFHIRFAVTLAFFSAMSAPLPTLAETTEWVETLGARMRMHLDDTAPQHDQGTTPPWRAVLEIELEPGWKTYWRDPGANGIPPQIKAIDASADEIALEQRFPLPTRFTIGDDHFGGYEGSLRLGLLPTESHMATPQKVEVFVGLCSDICVPFQTEFQFSNGGVTDSQRRLTAFKVGKIYDALPTYHPATEALLADDQILLQLPHNLALEPANFSENLFVATTQGWVLGAAQGIKPHGRGDMIAFPVIRQGKMDADIYFTVVDRNQISHSGFAKIAR